MGVGFKTFISRAEPLWLEVRQYNTLLMAVFVFGKRPLSGQQKGWFVGPPYPTLPYYKLIVLLHNTTSILPQYIILLQTDAEMVMTIGHRTTQKGVVYVLLAPGSYASCICPRQDIKGISCKCISLVEHKLAKWNTSLHTFCHQSK